MPLTAVMMATEMPAAIGSYWMAAPDSSRQRPLASQACHSLGPHPFVVGYVDLTLSSERIYNLNVRYSFVPNGIKHFLGHQAFPLGLPGIQNSTIN